MNVWKNIDTAPPEDYFMAFSPVCGMLVGRILRMGHPDCEYDGGVHDACSHRYIESVTHWADLPEPPKN